MLKINYSFCKKNKSQAGKPWKGNVKIVKHFSKAENENKIVNELRYFFP